MKVEVLRAKRNMLRSSQYLVAKLSGISRNRLSLIECKYVKATDEELKKIHLAICRIEADIRRSTILRTQPRGIGDVRTSLTVNSGSSSQKSKGVQT